MNIASGNDFILRTFQYGDEASLALAANDERVAANLRDVFPNPYTLDNAKEWVNFQVKTNGQQLTSFAIIVNDKVAGGIAIVPQDDVAQISAEIGYWLGVDYWGRGIATEAVGLMATYAFEHFPTIHRLFAKVYSRNVASMRVLEKVGFVLEGIHRESVQKNDVILDEHHYALLKRNFSWRANT
ncbi:MAG: GNAT family protein [Spirosomataceae bacterium]